MASVIRIKPLQYIHVLDHNAGCTRLVNGPCTFTRQEHEKVLCQPRNFEIVPPRHYCVISNPIQTDASGGPKCDSNGNYVLSFGDQEIRFGDREPFPLYPGEKLVGEVQPLRIVGPSCALKLRCMRNFTDGDVEREAGDEWLFYGPATYIPRVEVAECDVINATVIYVDTALRVRAKQAFTSSDGVKRRAGEEWMVRKTGSFLPNLSEEVVEVIQATVLNDRRAVHVRATRTHNDQFGTKRKAGEEWLVTKDMCETFIPDVDEVVVGQINVTTLTKEQYCVVCDPWGKDGKPQLGKKELHRGPESFFLNPGERLQNGIQNVHVLAAEEALLLRANEEIVDNEGKPVHAAGDRWMIHGPCDYVPPTSVEIIEMRRAIPLDTNEGVYIRDIKTGQVRAEIGRSVQLKANEELWEKKLPKNVESLLKKYNSYDTRDRTRVVSLRVPYNAVVQIYDYKKKDSRVIYGPNLVMLQPEEEFTLVDLSGGKPKRPHQIKSLYLLLGPDFMTDIITVETADHARLRMTLSYNWQFNVEEGSKLPFNVPDFVGDACKAIAGRVRGRVASTNFDEFHKRSARIIRESVFGVDGENHVRDSLVFKQNGLSITNVDIKEVTPVDENTRDSLQQSVQLAIEITTKSTKAEAQHMAEKAEQEARGQLQRQKITDEAQAEAAKKELLALQAQSTAVECTGQATAEAKARADAAQIEGQAAVRQAELKAKAQQIQAEAQLEEMKLKNQIQVEHAREMDLLLVDRKKRLGEIEAQKFDDMIEAIGADTLGAIAAAGPETQAKLLQSLGLNSMMITDGSSPINLFNAAKGLIGSAQDQ